MLLVFYPFAFSGICTGELCQLHDELADYTDAGVKVLAISTDPVYTLKAYKERRASTSRCCRTSGRTAPSPRPTASSTRRPAWRCAATFLIDAEGTVAFAEVNAAGDAREQSGWKDAVGAAQ